jgi:hypothetical protein
MRWKPRKARISVRTEREAHLVRIIWDAAIATTIIGDGRLIPLLIIDASERPDVGELVRIHKHLPPGDVICQWGDLDVGDGKIDLFLRFERPAELVLILQFDIVSQGGFVDYILIAKAVYIQPGMQGDRIVTSMDNPRILVEIPDTGFQEEWNRMFHKHIFQDLRRKGLSRKEAKLAATRFIEEWQEFGRFRMKRT